MRIAVIDPAAGVSGDMMLGALIDLGADALWLESLPERLGFDHVETGITSIERCSVTTTRVVFRIGGVVEHGAHGAGEHEHGRHVGELIELIEKADLSPHVKERAKLVFQILGDAEGRVHGVPSEQVHLHEVGAVDAVLDVVGAVEGFDRIGVDGVYNLPVAVGTGWVDAAHGTLPVPAPATANILAGLDVTTGGPVIGEATTPTGAALVKGLSSGAPPQYWRMVSTGWGAGSRNPDNYPNALRIMIGEAAGEAAVIEVLSTDVDDMQPEYIEPLREALFAAGALDCVVWPTQGKKGRVGFRVEAYATLANADTVADEMFRNSTTAGLRRVRVARQTLERSLFSVALAPSELVRVKVLNGPDGQRFKAEYDDVVKVSADLGRSALEIARQAENLAAVEFHKLET